MIELQPRSPLAGMSPRTFTVEGFEMRELPNVTKICVQSRRSTLQSGASPFAGLPPNSARGVDPIVLWTSPGEWFGYSPSLAADQLMARLRGEVADASLALTDVSAGSVVLELRGGGALEVLMRDCTIDLEGNAIQPGYCAQTVFAQIGVLIHRPGEHDSWRLFVDRSVAVHVWEWMVDTATYGR